MHLECLVEEPSAEALLNHLLPRMLPQGWKYKIHPFQGKCNLLKRLPDRLKSYAGMMRTDPGLRLLILVDKDREDCHNLKKRLENQAKRCGLLTKSHAGGGEFRVLNRIAVHELESWFFGDIQALRKVYPKLPVSFLKKKRYRFNQPDDLNDAWEALEKLLQSYDYFPGGLPKVENANLVGQYMNPARNTSKSFQIFYEGITALSR